MQYDLFQDDDIEALYLEIDNLKRTHAKVQRGLFARHNELHKLITHLQSEINELKELNEPKKKENSVLLPFFGELIEVTR